MRLTSDPTGRKDGRISPDTPRQNIVGTHCTQYSLQFARACSAVAKHCPGVPVGHEKGELGGQHDVNGAGFGLLSWVACAQPSQPIRIGPMHPWSGGRVTGVALHPTDFDVSNPQQLLWPHGNGSLASQ
jgi:hypothetical protein